MTDDDRDERETRIYEYVEGLLEGEELRSFEAELTSDRELRTAVGRARSLLGDLAGLEQDHEPDRDLWPDIRARLEADRDEGRSAPTAELGQEMDVRPMRRTGPSRISLSLSQLIAAGIAVVLLSGGGTWLVMRTGPDGGPTVAEAPDGGPEAGSPESTSGLGNGTALVPDFASDDAFRDYNRAVSSLEEILDSGRDRLSPETVRILDESLASIDTAIRDARRALSEDPESGALNQLLGRHLKTKLDLLRRTAAAVRSNA